MNRDVTDEEIASLLGTPTSIDSKPQQGRNTPLTTSSQMRGADLAGSKGKTVAKYPWAEWADGSYHILTAGEDFLTPVALFRNVIHNYAARRGLYVATEKVDEGKLGIQFFRTQAERLAFRLPEEEKEPPK